MKKGFVKWGMLALVMLAWMFLGQNNLTYAECRPWEHVDPSKVTFGNPDSGCVLLLNKKKRTHVQEQVYDECRQYDDLIVKSLTLVKNFSKLQQMLANVTMIDAKLKIH